MAACSARADTIIALSEIDGLSVDVNHLSLAGYSAFDKLEFNPNDSPELRAAFAQLAAKLDGASSGSATEIDFETVDVFQDAVCYQ